MPPTVSPSPKRSRHRSPESQAEFKQELIAYAKRLYLEKGLEGMSIRALTEAFQLSPMAFYGYFDSKHDLVRHVWIDFFQELLERLLAAGRGRRSPVAVLTAHVDTYLDYWESHPDRFRMVHMATLDEDAEGAHLRQVSRDAVYRQLHALTCERVQACAYGKPLSGKRLQLQCDLLWAKALGYLLSVSALRRDVLSDRAALRKLVVKDIVETLTPSRRA